MISRHSTYTHLPLHLMLATLLLGGCAHSVRTFPTTGPMLVDLDQRPFGPRPEEYYSPFAWDGADQMLFRPLSRFFAVDPAGESVNVNAMDEVPNSSWFTGRIGVRPISIDVFTRAACDGPGINAQGPWTVVAAKPNGANPGFIIEDENEQRYLLKFDSIDMQPERATSADVIGSILYWAAGYYAPCNRIVFFDRSVLRVGDGVTFGEDDTPLTLSDLDSVFENAFHTRDGLTRAAASRFLPGRPIGPWRYEGTRSDDPNDVVAHEDRRELRGARVIAAWLNHFDAREQNTLAIWHDTDGVNGYVQHYYLDFGDILGSVWPYEGITRRLGHSAYLDLAHVAQDFVSLGLVPRPWRNASFGPTGHLFAYFASQDFEPDDWHPGYPNPAFGRASERDNAWMSRILAKLTPEQIQAAIHEAHFQDEEADRELFRILMERRERILRHYFRRLAPLSNPVVDGNQLCLEDLAVSAGLIEPERRPYYNRIWSVVGQTSIQAPSGQMTRRAPHWVCTTLPEYVPNHVPDYVPDYEANRAASNYHIVDIAGYWNARDRQAMPARVHLVTTATHTQVVGLERPNERSAP